MQQGKLGFDTEGEAQIKPPITLVRGYLNTEQQAALMKEAQTYPLSRPEIQVFGQLHAIPRQQVWFGDLGCDYLYSGLFIRALPWPKYAHKLRDKLARDYGLESNGVLVNRYADGKDCMGAHSDDEPEIAQGSHIASITLGATRDFVLKHKHSQTKYSISLNSGDLLIMHWPMQSDWLHSLPKRLKVKEPRWNYTFRQLVVNYHG
ncbi:alpha-ketoglutarate-dependent dioxygenase AlkB family protein [Shewanella putrefaciens]|uniref:alpha-ketoglutarate-dependent dioxygenase AlkB family protein n=1 Tax=Shewanella putrefaciens TaxID=24 RepID=UPI0035653CB4